MKNRSFWNEKKKEYSSLRKQTKYDFDSSDSPYNFKLNSINQTSSYQILKDNKDGDEKIDSFAHENLITDSRDIPKQDRDLNCKYLSERTTNQNPSSTLYDTEVDVNGFLKDSQERNIHLAKGFDVECKRTRNNIGYGYTSSSYYARNKVSFIFLFSC